MCSNTTTTSMVKNQAPSRRRPAARRTRKKPKFLSLKKELSPSPEINSGDAPSPVPEKKQLDLFPLHPESVDHLLDSGGGATLAGLLNAAAPASDGYAYRGQESEISGDAIMRSALLVRAAMKRGRVGEEKWVRYSEVVEKREEEVSSCSEGLSCVKAAHRSLSLKLDYQEILDAWSDKGSLYIGPADAGDRCPQTVPDLRDDDFFGSAHDCAYNSYGVMDSRGSVGNLWTVPENSGSITSSAKMEEEGGKEGCSKREASVLRYKEKRQNRLFSKQIRYQVRKLNAEKRPRMKGRFVKRN